ncbi:MAG: winged helix-turn-helix domain-containing protein [Patescibacteria group bacterium]|jgi:predicted transcriptional regulator
MLEQILSSVARTKILKFFCVHAQERFFVRELSRALNLQLNSIRRELANLEKFGFLKSEEENGKKYYYTNQDFPLFNEIKNLVFKSLVLEEMTIAGKMSQILGLKLLVFTGVLTGSLAATDVLIVGNVNKSKFDSYLKKIADGLPEDLRYTFLSVKEYLYRIDVTDKFVYNIWANNHVVVVDKLSKDIEQKRFSDYQFKHFKEEK